MRTTFLLRIICTLVILGTLTPGLQAAKKKKKKPADPSAAEVTVTENSTSKNQIEFVAEVGANMNVAVLSPLEVHFSRNIRPDLVSLRDNLLDEVKEKPAASPDTYKTAVRLVDAWLSALDERNTRRGSLGMAAPPTTDMAHSKKTTLHFWDDILTFQRELKDAGEKRADDKQKQAFFKDADKNNWRLRTEALRPNLEKLYSQFRELRRESL